MAPIYVKSLATGGDTPVEFSSEFDEGEAANDAG
jgi:hypothetical protein